MKFIAVTFLAFGFLVPVQAQEISENPVSTFQLIADSIARAIAQSSENWRKIAGDMGTAGRAAVEENREVVDDVAAELKTTGEIVKREGQVRLSRAADNLEVATDIVKKESRVRLQNLAADAEAVSGAAIDAAVRNESKIRAWFRKADRETREKLDEAAIKAKQAEIRLLNGMGPAVQTQLRKLENEIAELNRELSDD